MKAVKAVKALKSALFAFALSTAAATALAQADMPDGKWWKRPRLAAEINLTAPQEREIEKIFVRTRPRLIDLRADLEKKQLALQVSMEDHAADRHTIEKEIESVETARAELQKARALMILDMKQVLKPEQWDRLLQMQQSIRERRQMIRDRMEERFAAPDRPKPRARQNPEKKGSPD